MRHTFGRPRDRMVDGRDNRLDQENVAIFWDYEVCLLLSLYVACVNEYRRTSARHPVPLVMQWLRKYAAPCVLWAA